MSLVPLARRMVANTAAKRSGKPPPAPDDALTPTPAPTPPVPDVAGPVVSSISDLDAHVLRVQTALADAAATTGMRHDPYQAVLTGLSMTVGLLPDNARRWDAAVQDVIAARHPLTPEERAELAGKLVEATEKGAFQATRKEAARMIRRLDRDLAVRMGAIVSGAFIAGCVLTGGVLAYFDGGPFRPEAESGAAWRELVRVNPDPRSALAAGEIRTDRATGRRYYAGVSLWLDPSRPPPGAPAKQ